MLKTKKHKLFLVAIVIFSMVAMYGSVPNVKADSLTDAKDVISDSGLEAINVHHTFSFTTSEPLVPTDLIEITFPATFSLGADDTITCPSDAVGQFDAQVLKCEVVTGIGAGAQTINVSGTTNPGAPSQAYTIPIVTKHGADVIESVDVMVYIIDDISVTANVPANLTFTIAGLGAGVDVNGVQTTVISTAATSSFGTLSTTASSTVGQQLTVSTNADDGYIVTVFESSELTNGAGSNINSFDNSPNGTGSSTPHPWAAPRAALDEPNTYGHMGITSEDASISGGNPFGDKLYAGFTGTSTIAVMSHDGPVNGTVDSIGVTQVAYTVEISALQEAGDYQAYLTYVCTPQY